MPIALSFLVFSFVIIQQPAGAPYSITRQPEAVTQYGMVQGGNVGILAHEDLAGSAFDDLQVTNFLTLKYPHYSALYRIAKIERYTATDPYNIWSLFVSEGGDVFASDVLYNRIFETYDRRLILQTCFDGARGRLFIIAYPIKQDLAQREKTW